MSKTMSKTSGSVEIDPPPPQLIEPDQLSPHLEVSSNGSFCSGLTEDRSVTSMARLRHSIGTVLSDSIAILRGQSPGVIPEEGGGEEEADVTDGTGGKGDDSSAIRGGVAPHSNAPTMLESSDMEESYHSAVEKAEARGTETIDFLKDSVSEMTYGRRIALHLMKTSKLYNPRLGVEDEDDNDETEAIQNVSGGEMVIHSEKPSLEKAWAYFEHVTMTRHVVEPEEPKEQKEKKGLFTRIIHKLSKGDQQLELAEPGENLYRTKLYSPIFTPHTQLGDFGIGVGLYFSALRSIAILTFVAGILNTSNIVYFSGNRYSDRQEGVPIWLKGSAICTDQDWVPCPDCQINGLRDDRLALPTDDTVTNSTLVFALKNNCDGATLEQGMLNFATLLFVIVGIMLMNRYFEHIEVKFDEDEQTAQDYSIIITNPPDDARDPEEWRAFFAENFGAEVTACTVGLDNDFLVQSLVEHREVMRKIELCLEPGTSLETLNLANIAAKTERERKAFGVMLSWILPGLPELFGRAVVLKARIQGLAQQEYPASNVFITFEKETDQRNVLSALSIGSMQAARNDTSAIANPRHLFRGNTVLAVGEPDEPDTIRWQDLNAKFKARIKQLALTIFATVVSVVLIAVMIQIANDRSLVVSAFMIAVFNLVFPQFAKLLTAFEAHASESGKQTSLYFKIVLFRWVNTAVIITIITPFERTLSSPDGLLDSIYAQFFAEIVTTTAAQLLDPSGHFERHFMAPRAKTQDAMNLNMRGQSLELAERYTNMTKILFLTLWYCSIYPAVFFMCSASLFINYFVDRFSLMRTWKRPPRLGTSMSEFSRQYFFSLAIMAMAVMSSYFWSGFPFDNICKNDALVDPEYVGSWNLRRLDTNETASAAVSSSDASFRFCVQDFFRMGGRSFPFISAHQPGGDEWMTDEQETLTSIYGWASVAVAGFIFLSFIWGWLDSVSSLFQGDYSPCGEVQGINFSEVPTISTYVPQVESSVFSYPLLAANIDNIDRQLFEWTDPDRPHSFYDLTKDAHKILEGADVSGKDVFSRIKHWPPNQPQSSKS